LSADIRTVVVGGGIVGLAVAEALVSADGDVLLVERHARLGQETTSRNSEVVHAGLYDPPGSLKARLCVEGRHRLADFCRRSGVPIANLGKLVVACAPAEIPALEALAVRAAANGVDDARLIGAGAARDLEPALACAAALLSPSTAVVDGAALMLALEARYLDRGGLVATGTNVVAIERADRGFRIVTVNGGCETAVVCHRLVLSGGLNASHLGALLAAHLRTPVPVTHYARGHYFVLRGPRPFSRLVYPLPANGGLGIHVTLSTSGETRFGPDLEWSETPSLAFDEQGGARRTAFVASIRRYWPEVDEHRLEPGHVGVRPRLASRGAGPSDFRIEGPATHGLAGLVALYGIESPGLTASLAIGSHVADLLARDAAA